MKSTLQKLFRDESGFIISTELVLVATIVVIGMIVGLSEVQHAVVAEMNDVADAIGSLNQSYTFSGFSKKDWGWFCWPHAQTFGSTFYDAFDECDNNQCDLACDLPLAEGPKTAWAPGPGPGPWAGGGYGYNYGYGYGGAVGGAYAGASSAVVVDGAAVGSSGVVVGSGPAAGAVCPPPNPYAPGVPAASATMPVGVPCAEATPCGSGTPCAQPCNGLPAPGPAVMPPADVPAVVPVPDDK